MNVQQWNRFKETEFDPYWFNISVVQYTQSQEVKVAKGCNLIEVTNLGTGIIQVNGVTLFPSATPATVSGDSIIIGGNKAEIYKGNLVLKFVAPLGAAPLVEVIQKFYTNYES